MGINNQSVRLTGSAFDPDSADFTVDAWVKFSGGTGTTRVVYSSGYNLNPLVLLYIDTSDKANFFMRGDNGLALASISPATVNDNNWHFLAGVRSGTTATLFVDGVAQTPASNASFGSISASCGFATLGGIRSDGACPGDGNVSIRVCDRRIRESPTVHGRSSIFTMQAPPANV